MRSNRRYWFDIVGNSRFQGHFQGQTVDKYKNLDIGRDFYFRLYDLDLGRDYYFKLDSLDVGRDFYIDSNTRKNIDVGRDFYIDTISRNNLDAGRDYFIDTISRNNLDVGRDFYVDNQILVKFIDVGQKYIIDGGELND